MLAIHIMKLQKEVKSNPVFKKIAAPKKAMEKKRYEIQGGGQ